MLISILQTLFKRDLNKLKAEIEMYQNAERIWYVEKSISNSAGNLCLHLVGNLNSYIGAEIGKSNYIRNRPEEFSLKNLSRAELINMVENTIQVIEAALNMLAEEDLLIEYPQPFSDEMVSTGYFLTHLATHLNYHLGQINYHRRLLDN